MSWPGTDFWVAAGTLTLAGATIWQMAREGHRQRRLDRPWLLMTGARAGTHGCRVEINNLSTHPIAIDGLYADWHQPKGDKRLDFDGRTATGHVSYHRAVLRSGDFVTRWHPFHRSDDPQQLGRASAKNPEYSLTSARLTVEFHYPPKSADKITWSWDVRLFGKELEVTQVGRHG